MQKHLFSFKLDDIQAILSESCIQTSGKEVKNMQKHLSLQLEEMEAVTAPAIDWESLAVGVAIGVAIGVGLT